MVSSASLGPRSLIPERDAYSELLRDTRGLRREQAQAREAWFQRLPLDGKEEILFELEILLKGLACFANPRNHPGPTRRIPVVAQDFREPLVAMREAMTRCIILCRALLGERERAFVFQRYLETVVPDDGARTRLVQGALTQDTPEESLFVLRHALTNLLEVTSGVARLPRVPFRLFYSVLGVAFREVSQSAYFNPLSALEFRPEFDRITNPQLLDLMRHVPGEQARRLVALTFLSLFRMLRYLALVEGATKDTASGWSGPPPVGGQRSAVRPGQSGESLSRRMSGVVFSVISVLRSDARALTGYLRQRTGSLLADSYERELFKVPSAQMAARYDMLLAEGHRLLAIKATLGGIGSNLRLEIRRAFEHDFPSPETAPSGDDVRAAVQKICSNLRPALMNAILFLGKSLGTRLDEHGVFNDDVARRNLSERLRRDVWMFAQIVRAFSHKARGVPGGEERWGGPSSLQFVREFLAYFRAMGYPLLRTADYPRFDAFMGAMATLQESDLLDPLRLQRATAECDQFYDFLVALFEQIGRRDELAGILFDRRAAAESLKLYLGD